MTDPTPIATSDVDDHTNIQIDAPEHPWYYTQVRDWILLCPDIDHTAYRVYSTFIAVTTKQSRFKRRLTLDQVRWLTPGVNGKPMKWGAFRNALKVLDHLGLVRVAPCSGKSVQARDAATGKFTKQESVLFKLGTMPTDPETFEGWCNAFEKLDAYPGPGWDKPSAQTVAPPRQGRAQNFEHGADQGERTGKQRDAPDSHRAQNFDDPAQNSERRAQNFARTSAVPTENEALQDSSTRQLYKTVFSLWVDHYPSVPSRNARDGDETHAAPEPTSATDEQSNDGRTDGTGPIPTNPSKNRGTPWDQADWPALLREDEVYDALAGKPSFKRSQVAQLAKFVARSIRDHGEPAVRGYLLDVASIAATTTFVFDAFSAGRWNDPQDVAEVERWDVRQATAAEAEAQRQQEHARINQTRAKQQRAYEAELDRRQADQLAARRRREQAPEPDQPSQVSPVSWLSVDQFEKLSPQDKACVRAHGNTPEGQLKKLPAKQIARIKATAEAAAA